MTQITAQLQLLGLGKNESAVYLALFELGACKAGAIIEHTNLHRNLVYTALEELVSQKLVATFKRKNIAMFEANSPKALVEKIDAQKNIAASVYSLLKKKQIERPHEIKIYEGIEGVVESRKVSLKLKDRDTIYSFGGSELMYSDEISAEWKPFHDKRVNKNINLKMLCDSTVPQKYIDRKNSQPRTVAKRLPIDVPLPALFEVYGDTLNIAVPSKTPVVFSLESPEACTAMKNFFEYFWRQPPLAN